jgi:hypothetical protein
VLKNPYLDNYNMDSEDIVRNFHQKRGRIRDPEKIHPGSGSRIQGVKKHWSTGSWIRIHNTGIARTA